MQPAFSFDGIGYLDVKSWVHSIYILLIQFFAKKLYRFAKTLEMNDFPFSQEFDHIVYIRVIGQSQNVVIGHTRLLFCS